MPIKDYPFTTVASGVSRPMLWIKVTNPTTHLGFFALAIVDTGADNCLFPAPIATYLGHNLESVPPKIMKTASGSTFAYPHTSRVDILEMLPNGMYGTNILYSVPNTPIDFAKGCQFFLLGRRNFLNKFVLTIHYPRQIFSIRFPTQPRPKKKIQRRRR